MRRSLAMQAQEFLMTRRQNRRRVIVLRCLAIVVTFVTAYALIMPAITQSNAMLCGKEEHTHTDACWMAEMAAPQPELICAVGQNRETVIHTHGGNCYDWNGEPICTLPEREEHVHDSGCYREFRELICQERQDLGHIHTSACHTYVRGALICGREEDGGSHVHTDACYRVERGSESVCGQGEGGGHAHTDTCYQVERGSEPACGQEEGDSHVHTGDCYTIQNSSKPKCGKAETEGHTHTDGCYTEKTVDVLSCRQPESDDILDEEGNVVQPGHSHTGVCYTAETERVLDCGQRESEGHQHIDACYPEEKVLTCTQEGGEGHVHTGACYPEKKVLICEKEESRDHIHTDACYPEERVLACEEKDQGHTHSDSCYEWTQELHCHEEEREPGHSHTDECYEITELLVCREEELILHVHTDGCYEYTYDEDTGDIVDEVLVCSRPEVISHQHTDECFYTPEGEPVETRVLTCGEEEHIHSEECYVEIAPKEEDVYFCGQTEHIHSADCYFDSGELRCTIPEHVHSLTCLEEQPPVLEIPEEPRPERVELDEYFTYETEAFHATFHATGIATLADPEDGAPLSPDGGNGQQTTTPSADPPVDNGSGEDVSQPQEPDTPDEPSFDSSAGEYGMVISGDIDVPKAGSAIQARSAFRPEDAAWSEDTSQTEDTPQTGDASQTGDTSGDTSWWGDISQTEDFSQPESNVQINFLVSEPEQDSMEYQEIASSVPQAEDEEGLIILSVLTFSVVADDGRMVDLSQCEIEAEVVFKETLVDALANMESEPLTIDGVEIDNEGRPEQGVVPEIMLGAFADEDAEEGAAKLSSVVVNEETAAGPVAMTFSVSPKTRGVALTARAGQFPQYTVEYYAMLNRPAEGTSSNEDTLIFIDTEGGNLPKNGRNTSTKVKYLELNDDGSVKFEPQETQIYQTATLRYSTVGSNGEEMGAKTISEVAGIMYNADSGNIDDQEMLHQTLWQIKVWQPGDTEPTLYPREAISDPAALKTYFEETLRFINAQNASDAHDRADENTIAITEGTKLRVVYQPTKGSSSHTATFYDYDITGGPNTATQVNTNEQGINSAGNYSGSGTKYAFGNSNTSSGTGLGNLSWNGNNLNMANKPALSGQDSFGDCTFGLAWGTGGGPRGDGLIFSSGVNAPNLFGSDAEGAPVTGRTVYNGQSLGFIRDGDTYTLSNVSGNSAISASNLEKFGAPTLKYGTGGSSGKPAVYFRSNSFWPMDSITNEDPHFGDPANVVKFNGATGAGNFPNSDDGRSHNNYFGMHFKVGFTIPKGYSGPLEYYFYGDDDMWVFLHNAQSRSEKLVCDIGGIHSAVGEYVNLWDYVLKEGETPETPRDGDRTFYLDFYYTERGASGSTCWMQFTLPNMIKVPTWTSTETPTSQYLRLEKQVDSNVGTDASATYKFNLTLHGNNENGFEILKNEVVDGELIYFGQTREIELKVGEKLEIRGLPNGTKYEIKEIPGERSFDVNYTVNGKPINGACIGEIKEGADNKADIICTNYFRAQLPETGGPGDCLYTWAGTLLIAAACCLWYKKQTYRGGARDET